ncbi:MAG: hypothetical protein KIT42_08360 [Rhodocyclaceae bacterium]|jgi:hypothetical protein|nr:hypothetical protein [Rhodocyclaceae bacterium]
MSVTSLQQSVLWGQLFEVAVKRGVIAELLRQSLVEPNHPSLAQWSDIKVSRLYQTMKRELEATDDNYIGQVKLAVAHMLELGYGLGLTCMREYIKRIKERTKDRVMLKALWCPLVLPGLQRNREEEATQAIEQLKLAFGVEGALGREMTARGYPAWSDFTLWLTTPTRHPDNLLVLEFSYNAPQELPDFSLEEAHLGEVQRFAHMLDARGVFSRVCAEVKGERFELAPSIASHLGAFTARDKPFFKVCQGASYVDTTFALLHEKGLLSRACDARVIAVTSNGFESLAARYEPGAKSQEPRVALMRQLANAYRNVIKVSDEEAEERLTDEIAMVFRQLSNALPGHIRKQVRGLERLPEPGGDIDFNFSEPIKGFFNPMHRFEMAEAVEQIDDSPEITEYFGKPGPEAVSAVLKEFADGEGLVPLRGLHSAAVVAALRAMHKGRMNVLALEGNPGIGKTTAVRRYLSGFDEEGFLFLYVSPRVVINKDVTDKFAKDDKTEAATGILTITTNATLIRAAGQGYEDLVVSQGGPKRNIDSAAVAEGVEDLVRPECSTWFLTPEEEDHLENLMGGQRFRKESLSERQDLIRERGLPGVLRTLALSALHLLGANREVNRIVLTAAMQGYREMPKGTTTINALSRLFESSNPKSPAGMAERKRFAERIPNIVVMIDEVAGDGAGALFVREVAEWLDKEFLEPFENLPGGSPFKVGLIVSDASLGNEMVLESYLSTKKRAPDKVLVSPSGGDRPFRLAATKVDIGPGKPLVLHVMTNSYPASKLDLEYRIRLTRLESEVRDDGSLKGIRERIRSQMDASLLLRAREEIYRAIRNGGRQVIYFAQDKEFLRDLGRALSATGDFKVSGKETIHIPNEGSVLLAPHEIAILDSSVTPKTRKKLVEPRRRDKKRVFLMTSSGARGVSFPLADWIIAAMPRFNIESSLMEVAQLIYRGRGGYPDPANPGNELSGDHFERKLVMVIDDFIDETDLKQDKRLWLRRASDLLTLVMMLRATIFTRITGDAGMPGRNLAVVPVGMVGTTELLSTMNQPLQKFLKEGAVYLRESPPKELAGLVAKTIENVSALFSAFQLDNLFSDPNQLTLSIPKDADELAYRVSQELSPLIPEPVGPLAIPDNISCVGPFWLEDWSEFDKVERFTFDKYSEFIDKAQQELKGQLYSLNKNLQYPPQLRQPARELYRILARESEEAKREFSTVKPLASKATILAFPLDYPRFWRKSNPEDGMRVVVQEGDEWRNTLGKSLQSSGEILPVIPHYEDFPYAASVGTVDPARLEQVFDDRYFMASAELNLLNTLLLAEAEDMS